MIQYKKFFGLIVIGSLCVACSGGEQPRTRDTTTGGSTGAGTGAGTTGTLTLTGGIMTTGSTGTGSTNNPGTCQEAAANRTYIGCDFWPTVTYNPVYTDFSFAVVVANAGGADANITIERGGMQIATATAKAHELATLPLPWVMELKGDEFTRNDQNTGARKKTSVFVAGGAYHLTSSVPVTVWQFSPLDYQQPAAKCPGLPATASVCLSVSNDASLLLPSTAMTGNYRLFGRSARLEGGGEMWTSSQGGFAITGTQNGTTVDIQLTPNRMVMVGTGAKVGPAQLAAGPGVMAAMPGQTITYTLQAGDVLQMVGTWAPFEPEPHGDLSGSIVRASKPVQVVAFNALINGVPTATDGNPDHVEETVLPAQVIGKSYVVAAPTGPSGRVPGHMVRFFGNVAGTMLTYPDGMPAGAPTTLADGEVVEIGPVTAPFVVNSNQPFAVLSLMLGGTKQDPGGTRGDPSITMEVTPEQFRKQYTFLAPTNYLENYVDILAPPGTTLKLDDMPLMGMTETIGANWTVVRAKLGAGKNGAHNLEASSPIGLQVMGFGLATSYCYPGGLDLKLISIPPDIH